MKPNTADTKLNILVMGDSVYGKPDGPKSEAFKRLDASLRRSPIVQHVEYEGIPSYASAKIQHNAINTIFIDPFSLYDHESPWRFLDEETKFIFEVREKFPGVVFVLYIDFRRIENIHFDCPEELVTNWSVERKKRYREHFYAGERSRFAHYYKL